MRCVAIGCKTTHLDGVSFYPFPTETTQRKKWIQAVGISRADWQPTKHSMLCGRHFEAECFEMKSSIGNYLGVVGKIKKRLVKGAIPTVFEKPKYPGSLGERPPVKKGKSTAYEKRERKRVIQEIMANTLDESVEKENKDPVPQSFNKMEMETQDSGSSNAL
ncbi:THAP domain-containing protein 10-like [Anneissia japonica]|uniref:THAP domain-containing protein 10-like n=1 Tax=Anneissia japonica TaxID=1529436 RepID=UPI0014255237|nr:THAP domain-containing protein 10-like [Anneissia japonica]